VGLGNHETVLLATLLVMVGGSALDRPTRHSKGMNMQTKSYSTSCGPCGCAQAALSAAREQVPLSEMEWQLKVVKYAVDHGWDWLHIPRSKVGKVWLTRAEGTLGKGWFDLLLIRGSVVIGVELKAANGKLRPDQVTVHIRCQEAMEGFVWRPSDWDEVQSVLA
jgi:hypothetical protein